MSGGLIALLLATPVLARELPPGFVYLRDVAPSIVQDMRYAGSDNFTGHPVPGYGAAECVLRRDVAQALANVQADLAKQARAESLRLLPPDPRGLSLCALVAAEGRRYDQAFLSGAGQARAVRRRLHRRAFGAFDRQRGRPDAGAAPRPAGAAVRSARGLWRLHRPADQRAPDNALDKSLDMGTGFDCFDPKSSAFASNITAEQNHRRVILIEAMRKRGFRNYVREWWHFSFGTRGRAYDFAIEARSSSTSP